MKRLLIFTTLLLCSLLTFAQFSGTVSDSQGVKYTANNDESTCYVSGHESNYSAAIVIPEVYEGRSVTSIGDGAFYGCSGLTSLTIPTSVTSIGYMAFEGCSGLTSLTIPSSVTSIGMRAFRTCSGLTSIIVKEGNTIYDSRDNCNAIIRTTDNTLIAGCKNSIIPSSVTSIGDWAFSDCSGLTSLTIPTSVTSIGDWAFSFCSGLTSLTIPTSVTSIGDRAFSYCSGLTSLTIPTSVTSIGDEAFSYCSGLTSLTIPSSVTSIGEGAFGECSGLKSIVVEEGNTIYDSRDNCNAIIRTADNTLIAGCKNSIIPSSVTSIGDFAFFSCRGLTSLTIPENVTLIGDWAFSDCSGLTSLTIPSSVTSIGDFAFFSCRGLTSVAVGWETPLGIDGSVFDNSNNNNVTLYVPKGTKAAYEAANVWKEFGTLVEMLDISDGAVSDSQGVRYTANDDESTCYVSGHDDTYSSDIIIPNTFKGRHVTSIGAGAFSGCGNLTSLTVRWGTPIAIDGTVFEGSNCQNAVLRVPIGSKAAYDAAEGWSDFGEIVEVFTEGQISDSQGVIYQAYYDDEPACRVIGHEATYSSTIIIPEFYGGSRVTSIDERAFQNCSDLTSVTIRENVMSIGGFAFYGCSGMTSVTIPSSVTSIGENAFFGCSGLTSVAISEGVTSIGNGAFKGCSSLIFIIVEEGNMVYDSRDNCNAIIRTSDNILITGCKNTVIPSSVTSIDREAFYKCSSLTSVTIPSSVTSIGGYAFYGCSGLTSVTIPSSVTSIGSDAFGGCSGLTSVTIPSSVTSIGGYTFYGCSSLTSVTIPSSVTSIGTAAFSGCRGLTSVTIPSSVTSIDSYVFRSCSSLTSLIVGWETPIEINDHVFNNSNYNNATLYVPKGTKAAYEAAAVWQDFGVIFECDLPQENVELSDISAIDNVIYMEPLEVTRGTEVVLSLLMKNTAGIRGFQFDMYLPQGVTVMKDHNNRFVCSLNSGRTPDGDQHTLTLSEQPDGAIRFLCGSQYDEVFTGTEGEILTVRLSVDKRMFAGQYPIVLKNVKLTETNINNYYETATVQTAMTVIAYTPGDISGDGVIDVSDYIGVANYIMGDTPAGFVAAAADVNKDQKVDVSDYIGIANMILYNNIYGKTVNESRGMGRRRANTDVSTLDNVIYISPFSVLSNDEAQVSIRMKNTVGIRGFQFDLYLPEGMTAVKDGNSRYVSSLSNGRKPAGDQHTLTLSEQPDGAIRFLCGSQYDETFTGTDGEIATLTINIDASVAVGDYPVYLRNMKLTETDISKFYTTDEVETTVTVTGAADGRVVLDETSTTAPEAANSVDVRVKRTINAGEWSTICLPFAMTVAQCQAAFGSDVQIGDFTGCTVVDDNVSVNFSNVTAMEANHPYIIKVSSAVSEFTVDGVDIAADNAEVKVNKSGRKYNRFIGNYENGTELEDGFLFLNANKFYFSNGSTKIKAFRGYFNLETADAYYEESRRIVLNFGDATGIETIVKDEADKVFNLSGQRVKTPAKGVFVKNGKKIIVK